MTDEIAKAFDDEESNEAIVFFLRYLRMGLPYRDWAGCPNMLVEIVDVLSPFEGLYHLRLLALLTNSKNERIISI